MGLFEGENTQYKTLCYMIKWYFHDYELAIKIDENGQSDRNIDSEINKKQKSMQ